jgi:hypothetical protein
MLFVTKFKTVRQIYLISTYIAYLSGLGKFFVMYVLNVSKYIQSQLRTSGSKSEPLNLALPHVAVERWYEASIWFSISFFVLCDIFLHVAQINIISGANSICSLMKWRVLEDERKCASLWRNTRFLPTHKEWVLCVCVRVRACACAISS